MKRIHNVSCHRRMFKGCEGCPYLVNKKGFHFCRVDELDALQ